MYFVLEDKKYAANYKFSVDFDISCKSQKDYYKISVCI